MSEEEEKTYLGDGVYATYDGYGMTLTANVPTTDKIYIEPAVLSALQMFWKRCTSQEEKHE